MLRLRFLNGERRVRSVAPKIFIPYVKDTLRQLSQAKNISELSHITKIFFKETFAVPINCTALYIRDYTKRLKKRDTLSKTREHQIEKFYAESDEKIIEFLRNSEILNKDELIFSNFYEEDELQTECINFLAAINADLVLPLYEEEGLIGFVVITSAARTKASLYTDVECDAMVLFASYLENRIDTLQKSNFAVTASIQKELKEELHFKERKIAHYQESIRSFVDDSEDHHYGIIFYKNHRFKLANKAAYEIVNYDIHQQIGHPLTKALTQIAHNVEK